VNVNLSNLGLTSLPGCISQLKAKELSLSRNLLTAIPQSIFQLAFLNNLCLDYNQLIVIPDSIGQLVNLTKISLNNNQLIMIPDSIGQLVNLTQINLSNNQLTVIPESIGQLSNLYRLLLYKNQLTMIPESIGQLKNLECLYLDYNAPLKLLPSSLLKLKKLNHLSIFGCDNLEYPPKEVANSKHKYASVDVHDVLMYFVINTNKKLMEAKSTLQGLCIHFIVIHVSIFNLKEIPLELKHKIDQYKKDRYLLNKK